MNLPSEFWIGDIENPGPLLLLTYPDLMSLRSVSIKFWNIIGGDNEMSDYFWMLKTQWDFEFIEPKSQKGGWKEEYIRIARVQKIVGTYFTEFNGGQPLRVEINRRGVVSVYRTPTDLDWDALEFEYDSDEYPEMYYNELMKEYRPRKIFLGEDVEYKNVRFWPGNTILLELEPGKYAKLHVGIEEFEIDDEIVYYYSPVGPNKVPYPVAVGKKYIYDMDGNYYPIKIYNEDVPEKDKFDFWHILDESSEGKPVRITDSIWNEGW